MIGRLTLIWMALAAGAAAGLFALKHEVQSREAELRALNNAIIADQDAIHVLRAEWSYLNQPHQLQRQADRHLTLVSLSTDRIGRLEAIPSRQLEDPMLFEASISPPARAGPDVAMAPPGGAE